ncbi:MAG: hypothetical protein ACI97A_000892 [Planctomycetota bacterium]|jgi:hypothetical protein
MAKTGCALIAFAIFLLVAFVSDQFYFRENREGQLRDGFREIESDIEEVDPRLADPELYAPSAFDDISSTRFMLNVDEMKLAVAQEDYIYVVKEGDSIDALAKKYLGRHELKDILYTENPDIQRGLGIPPGTKITIPFRHRIIDN